MRKKKEEIIVGIQERSLGVQNGVLNKINQKRSLFIKKDDIIAEEVTIEQLFDIMYLDFRGIGIDSLKIGDFAGLENLIELDLGENSIRNIPVGIFNNLHKLLKLDISKNKINILLEGSFEGLENLDYLYLQENNLSQFPKGVFKELCNLKVLRLEDNKVKVLENDLFDVTSANLRIYFNKDIHKISDMIARGEKEVVYRI